MKKKLNFLSYLTTYNEIDMYLIELTNEEIFAFYDYAISKLYNWQFASFVEYSEDIKRELKTVDDDYSYNFTERMGVFVVSRAMMHVSNNTVDTFRLALMELKARGIPKDKGSTIRKKLKHYFRYNEL